jgi:serine/threonine protein phosphatase PrpC
VLHEIHNNQDRSVIIAGVLDGHGGPAASSMVAETLPTLLSNHLLLNNDIAVQGALEQSWETVCKTYRSKCSDEQECLAEYDPREGVLMANTASVDLVPGTTASIFALDEKSGKLIVLNCGDSRSLVITKAGKVLFATKDHKPQEEEERLSKGREGD